MKKLHNSRPDKYTSTGENLYLGFAIRKYANQPAQLQRLTRILEFCVWMLGIVLCTKWITNEIIRRLRQGKVQTRQLSSATEIHLNIEILYETNCYMILCLERITNVLIRLRGSADWSAVPLFCACNIIVFSRDEVQKVQTLMKGLNMRYFIRVCTVCKSTRLCSFQSSPLLLLSMHV